ncbi:MAG: hypothetical protein KKF44_09245 [Nanoarchaeota archaeon]|nr:hypothetical protein [Nanoarchaeota archaeon]
MKKTFDKNGRTLYKYSHSVSQGGWVYNHKSHNQITNKQGLRNALAAIEKKLKLVDCTIKIYDKMFFLFCHIPNSLAPAALIESIQRNISGFTEWDSEYLFTGIYDLKENNIRQFLKKCNFDYDNG